MQKYDGITFLTQVFLPDGVIVPVGEELGHLNFEALASGSGSVLEEGAVVLATLRRPMSRGLSEYGGRPFEVSCMTSTQKI